MPVQFLHAGVFRVILDPAVVQEPVGRLSGQRPGRPGALVRASGSVSRPWLVVQVDVFGGSEVLPSRGEPTVRVTSLPASTG